jgi:SAM-dependent methyltransferase
MKLNIGCGNDLKKGWVNHDIASLPGVDIVHDLNVFPWPWADQSFSEIYMKDVLEHLPNTIRVMEELYRIADDGAKLFIAVPYWNSWEAITDPTHITNFNEFTFEFFDPTSKRCQSRPYYTHARFEIKQTGFVIFPLGPYIKIPRISKHYTIYNEFAKKIIGFLASIFNNVIIGLDVSFEKR